MRHAVFAAMLGILLVTTAAAAGPQEAAAPMTGGYKLLATSKTSTMQKELNEAAEAGYRLEAVMGGETGFGGKEVVAILSRPAPGTPRGAYAYKVLATNKTSTMQKEMSEAAAAGFYYRCQTVSDTVFGGKEVIVIMERSRDVREPQFEYKLLATNKTSTMQKELQEAAEAGYAFRGVTVSSTAFGGREVVVITERSRR